MVTVIGVRFKEAGKIYFFDPAGLEIKKGDAVIVETVRGIEYGQVVIGPREVKEEEIVQPLKKVIRKATAADRRQVQMNERKEKEAFVICQQKIAEHGLPMKLVDVEYTFDANKIIFYFTAEGRVDFRELVKDLAAIFRTRIELRQIGVRDEAKMVGGLGNCGRVVCCRAFLSEFAPVSIKMAKEQNLSLNPAKISGVCGRLMCCLKFENEIYEEEKKKYPGIGSEVMTEAGKGKVVGVNIIRRTLAVELAGSGQVVSFPAEKVQVLKEMREMVEDENEYSEDDYGI